jgi:hypothetical protein
MLSNLAKGVPWFCPAVYIIAMVAMETTSMGRMLQKNITSHKGIPLEGKHFTKIPSEK